LLRQRRALRCGLMAGLSKARFDDAATNLDMH
jgi:hypothetical protein